MLCLLLKVLQFQLQIWERPSRVWCLNCPGSQRRCMWTEKALNLLASGKGTITVLDSIGGILNRILIVLLPYWTSQKRACNVLRSSSSLKDHPPIWELFFTRLCMLVELLSPSQFTRLIQHLCLLGLRFKRQ